MQIILWQLMVVPPRNHNNNNNNVLGPTYRTFQCCWYCFGIYERYYVSISIARVTPDDVPFFCDLQIADCEETREEDFKHFDQ